MNFDLQLYHFLHSAEGYSPVGDALIYFCAIYLPIVAVIGAVLYILKERLTWRQKLTDIALTAGAALFARYVVTAIIRLIANRARPFTVANATSLFHTTGSSFPSAHATVLFTIAMMLYGHDRRAGWIFFVLALIVCTARVMAGVHYPLDIIAGALVGITTGALALLYVRPRLKASLQ